ncbi:MAG: hypothetical protein KDD41_01600 [Flavobacteriales bacterium]|nr:hypothetical protein [Flavobacteriales bacterium]
MNKLNQLLLGCLLASFFLACSNPKAEEEEVLCDAETTNISPVNPNGDSELALVMRNLYFEADSLKKRIMDHNGNVSDEFIEQLQRVHTATPTDPTVKTDEFKAYNELLINQAKALQEADSNRTEIFNQLVNRCIDCHQVVCPGPIKRIKKLTIH